MGLAGSDAWSLKVSPDGSAWTTALQVNAATGQASGAAVQQSATDVTAGRLMRADFRRAGGKIWWTTVHPLPAMMERDARCAARWAFRPDSTGKGCSDQWQEMLGRCREGVWWQGPV